MADCGLAIIARSKAETSSGVGGRPVRSKVARRISVRASAGGATVRPAGRRAARKASTGFAEDGERGRRGEGETGRRGEGETGRGGDGESGTKTEEEEGEPREPDEGGEPRVLREWPGEATGEVEEELGERFGVERIVPRGRGAQDGAEATDEKGGKEQHESVAA
jgi:hypothetical protein